jgi:hypothetical protein
MDLGKPRNASVMTADIPAEIRTKRLQPYLKTNPFGNAALQSLDEQSTCISIVTCQPIAGLRNSFLGTGR